MHPLISTDLSEWAAHRRAVVLAVSRRVPGANPETAASRGLARLCREIVVRGAVDRPVDFWHRAAVDAAAESVAPTAELDAAPLPGAAPKVSAARPVPPACEQGPAADGSTPSPLPPSIPPADREIDFEHLNTAMNRLTARDRQILWDRHVHDKPVERIAETVGVLPYAARRRLRRAEDELASGFADAHVSTCDQDECRVTRGAMHDYIHHRLLPGRRQELEDHLVECAECTRAFADVRESYWMLRAAAPVLLLGTVSVPGAVGAVTAGTATGAAVAGTTTGVTIGTALGGAGTMANSGATMVSSLLGKSAVLARTLVFDPTTLVAVVAGTILATGAATGVALRSETGPFPGASVDRQPLTHEVTIPVTDTPTPTAVAVGPESGAGVAPDVAATPSITGPAVPSPSDTSGVAGPDGDGPAIDVGLGDAIEVEAGADVEISEGRTEVTVRVAAEGKILYSLYEIVPLPGSEVVAIDLDRDFGLVVQVNDAYYVIPALASLTAADIRAEVTLVGREGTTAQIAAVTQESAQQEGFGSLTALVTELGTQLDSVPGETTEITSDTLSELLLTTDGTLRTTQGTVDDLHGALDETLDVLLNR